MFSLTDAPAEVLELTDGFHRTMQHKWKVYTVEWLCVQPNGCRAESNIGYPLPYQDVALNYFSYNYA